MQKLTPGTGSADVVVKVEADAAASDQIAGHALEADGLRRGRERREDRGREGRQTRE